MLLTATHQLVPFLACANSFKAGTAVSCAWLLVTALPLVMNDDVDNSTCRSSSRYHVAIHVLRQCCILPAFAALFANVAACAATSHIAALLITLTAASVMLGLEQQRVECPAGPLRLDFVHPPCFLAGLSLFQCVLCGATILNTPIELQIILSLLPLIWIVMYPSCFGPCGGPEWLPSLRKCAATAPVWAQLCRLAQSMSSAHLDQNVWLLGYVVLILCGATCLVQMHIAGLQARSLLVKEAGLPRVFQSLGNKAELLCRANETTELLTVQVRSMVSSQNPHSPAEYAAVLEAFEGHIRIERLDLAFLKRRSSWLQSLHAGYNSFLEIAKCAQELLAAIRTPPTTVLVIASLQSSSVAAKRVPRPVWALIMEFVGGIQPLSALLEPCLEHFMEGNPSKQLKRAQANMKWCVKALQQLQEVPEVQAVQVADVFTETEVRAEQISEDVELTIKSWWGCVRAAYGHGCPCGRAVKPTDYFVFKPPLNVILPCWPRRYKRCCRQCNRCRVDDALSPTTATAMAAARAAMAAATAAAARTTAPATATAAAEQQQHSHECNRRTQNCLSLTMYRLDHGIEAASLH